MIEKPSHATVPLEQYIEIFFTKFNNADIYSFFRQQREQREDLRDGRRRKPDSTSRGDASSQVRP